MSRNYKGGLVAGIIGIITTVSVIYTSQQSIDTKSNKLQLLIIHCSATREGQNVTAQRIYNMHTAPKEKGGRGWKKAGYRDVIELDGKIVNLHKYDNDSIVQVSEITNGTYGYNRISANVCYIGGMDSTYTYAKNTLTPQQDSALKLYVLTFVKLFPNSYVAGHNQFAYKKCPSFCVPTKCKEWGVPTQNIFTLKVKKY